MGMDISQRERLVYGGAAIGLLAVPLMYFYPDLTVFIAIPMLVVGTALLLIAILPMNISGWWVFIYGLIPLREAARIAYEKNHDNLSAQAAEMDFGNMEADPLGWYAHALLGSNVDPTRIPVFGCKPHLDLLIEIPPAHYFQNYLSVTSNDVILEDVTTNRRVKYYHLHIKKSDMKKTY
ncbi:MAG: hypothetical protein IIA06_11665 [Proteobacteria bacterium]|nr:hypothetical protein [Pseudomonadota bacterium]